MNKLKYTLNIEPMPTTRPRLGRNGVFNTSAYSKYKKDLIVLLKQSGLKKNDYDYLEVRFFYPYPKSTAKKRIIEGYPLRSKCDTDNLTKGFKDALEQGGFIEDDRRICGEYAAKYYTSEKEGRIEFNLEIFDIDNYEVKSKQIDKERFISSIIIEVAKRYGTTKFDVLNDSKSTRIRDVRIVCANLLNVKEKLTNAQISKELKKDKAQIHRYLQEFSQYSEKIPHEREKLNIFNEIEKKLWKKEEEEDLQKLSQNK